MSTRFARTNGTTRFNTLSIAKSPIPSLELDEEWNRLNTACNAIDDDLITARGAKASINQRFLDIETEVTNARDGEVNLLAKEDAQDALISAVQTEVTNARGSTGALDTRLDVALNEDGTLKAGATQNTTEWSSAAFAGLARSSDTQFTVNGDQTTIFLVGRKVRSLSGSTYAYHEVVSSAYVTVTTVTVSGTALPSPLNDVDFGIITPVASGQSSLPDLNLNADMVDGYDAGNAAGNIPVSNSTMNTNLNADMVDGHHAGNGSGAVPISNGTMNTNLNADMVDGMQGIQHQSTEIVVANLITPTTEAWTNLSLPASLQGKKVLFLMVYGQVSDSTADLAVAIRPGGETSWSSPVYAPGIRGTGRPSATIASGMVILSLNGQNSIDYYFFRNYGTGYTSPFLTIKCTGWM